MEIGIVLIIALVVFGPKKLPELGHSLGKGIREFKGTISGETGNDAEEPQAIAQPVTAATEAPVAVPTADVTVKQA
ncbi:MAG TPA: twin-arginine translocase TatA/TatE family subunit [Solirubrobacterales bacterium]|jgi:sec-independent protein translocase protein TatA|nr:twin-arginine translocase TatA/TatE family subunit [Solirubrobacterales bacterium]